MTPRSRRRLRITALVAVPVAVVLVVALVVAILVLRPSSATSAAAAAPVVELSGGGSGTVAGSGGGAVRNGQRLRSPSRLTAVRGPLGVGFGGTAVVRLDSGAELVVEQAAAGVRRIVLRTGRVYAAAGASPVALVVGSTTVRVTQGSVVATCARGRCTVQSLQGRQSVSGTGATTLQPHQLLDTGRPSAPAAFTATDALRHDAWISANARLDAASRLRIAPVTGRSVTGSWTFVFHSRRSALQDTPRVVDVRLDCAVNLRGSTRRVVRRPKHEAA